MSPFIDPAQAEPPTITPESLDDEELLAAACDAFVHRDRVARSQQAEILEQQAALRAMLDPGQWQALLHLEEMTSARLADAIVSVARWAFEQGQQSPKVKP